MDNAERAAFYVAQSGAVRLTPQQARRVRKHSNAELSPFAGINRKSRLRKALERKRRVELRHTGAHIAGLVRLAKHHH